MNGSNLSDSSIFLLIFTALLIDAFQAVIGWIPIFGNTLADLVSIAAFLIFFVWFKFYGISMITPKRLSALVAGSVIEMIPFVNILPAWTGVVVYLIGTTKVKGVMAEHSGVARVAMGTAGKIKKMGKNNKPPSVPFVDSRKIKQDESSKTPRNINTQITPNTISAPKKNPPNTPSIANDSNYAGYKQPDWMRDKSVDEVKKDPDAYLKNSMAKAKIDQEKSKRDAKMAEEMIGYHGE